VRSEDTEQTLAARVLAQEHLLYHLVLRWCVEERLVLQNGLVRLQGADRRQVFFAEE